MVTHEDPKDYTSREGPLRVDPQPGATAATTSLSVEADVTEVHFSYHGVAYTIDLDHAGAADFDAALAPYTSAARRVGGIRRRAGNHHADARPESRRGSSRE